MMGHIVVITVETAFRRCISSKTLMNFGRDFKTLDNDRLIRNNTSIVKYTLVVRLLRKRFKNPFLENSIISQLTVIYVYIDCIYIDSSGSKKPSYVDYWHQEFHGEICAVCVLT